MNTLEETRENYTRLTYLAEKLVRGKTIPARKRWGIYVQSIPDQLLARFFLFHAYSVEKRLEPNPQMIIPDVAVIIQKKLGVQTIKTPKALYESLFNEWQRRYPNSEPEKILYSEWEEKAK